MSVLLQEFQQKQGRAAAAAELGATIGFPALVTKWGRDELMEEANPKVLSAMLDRVSHSSMAAPEDVVRALEDCTVGRDGPKVKEHEKAIRAMFSYCERIGSPAMPMVHHFNTYDVPGIDTIPGVQLYALRAFGMAKSSSDLIVIPDQVPPGLIDDHKLLRDLVHLPNGEVIKLSEYRAHRSELDRLHTLAEFYRTSESPNPRLFAFQEHFENKNNSMRFLVANSIYVPELIYLGLARGVAPAKVQAYPVVLKQVRSAGGAGVFICDNRDQLESALKGLSGNEEIQIQSMVPGIDCSKQYYISDTGMVPISNTDQLIENGVAHAGNLVLSKVLSKEDNKMADRAARAIHKAGYRGYFSVDMIKPHAGGPARVIELNLRKGGVTAPGTVATHLGAAEFAARQIRLESADAAVALATERAYDEKSKEGLVVYSLVPLDNGEVKAGIVCLSKRGGRDLLAEIAA